MTIDNPDYPEDVRLKALIQQLDAYIAQYHGGSVELVSFDGKAVKVRLGGACLAARSRPIHSMAGWKERSSNSSRKLKVWNLKPHYNQY